MIIKLLPRLILLAVVVVLSVSTAVAVVPAAALESLIVLFSRNPVDVRLSMIIICVIKMRLLRRVCCHSGRCVFYWVVPLVLYCQVYRFLQTNLVFLFSLHVRSCVRVIANSHHESCSQQPVFLIFVHTCLSCYCSQFGGERVKVLFQLTSHR